MPNNNVALDIMEFIEQNILPKYTAFDKAHNLSHANSVIKRSLELARNIGADINMAYVIAAYHDLGLEGPRAIHHLTSGKILAADMRLRRWFSPEQIKIMREAVEDHRASASHAPRLWQKLTATYVPRRCSAARCSMAWRIIRRNRKRNNGSASSTTWKTNTQPTATSSCGFKTLLTRKRCA